VLVVRSDDVTIEPASGEKFDGVRTLRDHLRVHAGSDVLRERMRFLVDDPPSVEFAALVHRACDYQGELADRLAAAGLDAAWVDVTTEDVAAVGLRVIKTVIPSAQPLDNDHDHRFLGGLRLYSIARRFGRDLTVETVNPDPHPFP
jgi:ribosomal protein S12 methylthiotransferase accessory factor